MELGYVGHVMFPFYFEMNGQAEEHTSKYVLWVMVERAVHG